MLARSPRGWQESRSGRLVISHFPKQRHRQAAALPPVRPASLPPVPRSPPPPLALSLSLFLSLCILSRCFVPLRVPSTGRSRSALFSVSPRDSVPSSCLSRTTVSTPATLPSRPHPAPARRLRDPKRYKSPLSSGSVGCGFETFSLAPLMERNAAATALVFAFSPGAKPLARLS